MLIWDGGEAVKSNNLIIYTVVMKKQKSRSRRKLFLALCCLVILILNSCMQPITNLNSTATLVPTATFASTSTPLPRETSAVTPTPTVAMVSTLLSYPTPIYSFNYPNQVTDGILLLSVEGVHNKCYKSLEPIKLRFTFRNLTDEEINIPSDFSIAFNRWGVGGNLLSFITSEEGLDVYTSYDMALIDIFPTPSNNNITLLGNQEFEIFLIYGFPEFISPRQDDLVDEPIKARPGRYFLRFYYVEIKRDIDTWFGTIGSNRIEICVIN